MPVAAGRLASMVMLVVVMAGSATVSLLKNGSIASGLLDAPYTAAGRKMAMDVAEQLLKDNYGASASQSPMLMAGAYPRKSPVTYVVAALTDEPMTGVITTLEQATLHLADATMRESISLALTSVQRLSLIHI